MKTVKPVFIVGVFFISAYVFGRLFIAILKNFTRAADDSTLTVKLKMQGTQTNSRPKQIAKLQIYNRNSLVQENTDLQMSKQSDNNYQATLLLEKINSDVQYGIFIKPDKAIGKVACNTTGSACITPQLSLKQGDNQLDLTASLFLNGDIGNDGKINASDASLLIKYLGRNDQEAINAADLNSDGIVDAQDFALLIYSLSQNVQEEKIGWDLQSVTATPAPTTTPSPTATPTQTESGQCHAVKPGLAGGGSYNLANNAVSDCICQMGVCARAKCQNCPAGTCNCGDVPLKMPPISLDCSTGGKMTIEICNN